ncbi:PIN domain-containing protein (plasmid) [Legionella sp. D16C41]|uniref:PIN domain-containing protein n=1 Tax=Legionella sp. D16C41 TaxID=3402688 RepID=UPI003AF5BE3F
MDSGKLYLFMDANIYLSFYSYSKDNLNTLTNIYEKLRKDHFEIIVNELLQDEFNRRRESRFKETLDYKYDITININAPILLSDNLEDFENLKKLEKRLSTAAKEYNIKYKEILQKVRDRYRDEKLFPDTIIKRIFNKAKKIDITPEVLKNAQYRTALHNPPGKPNKLGDRLHWELLLHGINKGDKLIIISNDSDFFSLISNDCINPFLSKEWKKLKDSPIEAFRCLNDFLKVYLPEFELEIELAQQIHEE